MLIKSLWAPWCGYWAHGSLVLLDADGPSTTIAAIAEPPPTLYMRGIAVPTKLVPYRHDDTGLAWNLAPATRPPVKQLAVSLKADDG